ncbi:Major facilitator superfamily transporter [Metarhizium robertsii ARSEF 23]|uniref:Major facilitator superfamily transporter n=1 Tax=Metarhizium robertsii (strain ARSEF 23 / ATCC MYA-3075) TaxID=655844 RepID=E9EMP8_METRA|nr:Major facilitator superfamily transporter [Metarhizium robertsii ARSEF 23]EFZ04067.1 Major facilitator superfamily transporter [Metarhizium robertsii ARSEF 23]
MADIIRDAPLGQLIRWATSNRYLQYPEEKAGFKLPSPWQQLLDNPDAVVDESTEPSSESASTAGDDTPEGQDAEKQQQQQQQSRSSAERPEPLRLHRTKTPAETPAFTGSRLEAELAHAVERVQSVPVVPRRTKDGAILVDWYYSDDAENPQNWSNGKRGLVAAIICLYTFVVYTSSAIYTPSTQGVMERFHVSQLEATLGLSLYVLGYGVGPLVFSPLSEIPRIGRNPVYAATMILFVVLSIPTALARSFAGLMVLRFLQGFFGSPCLASGGASLGDMYSMTALPYAMVAWISSAYFGPALGPLLSGFSVPARGWRWSLYESVWASAPVLLGMLSELDQRRLGPRAALLDALVKPVEITFKDPAVLFVQVYTAIIYGIYYSFFEAFPLVYPVHYHMNLGQTGLVFLCILVACLLGAAVYCAYLYLYVDPRIRRFGLPVQESRLAPALPASFGPTVGLFIFAWTARESVHWIAPTAGITIYAATCFVVMQCIFVYVPLSYPQYAASLFAANDFFRSAMACGSVLFAHPLFGNLGVARGVSLLGGLSVIGIVGIWLLYFYGARLRALSKFATSEQ